MIWTDPDRTTLNGEALDGVHTVTLSQQAERVTVEYSDAGPHPAFVDASGIRATFSVRRSVNVPGEVSVRVGQTVALAVRGAATSAASRVHRASANVVVTKSLWSQSRSGGLEHTIEAVAVAANPAQDPVSIFGDEEA